MNLVGIFKSMDQTASRAIINECRTGGYETWRVFQAATTCVICPRSDKRNPADRTERVGDWVHLFMTGGADMQFTGSGDVCAADMTERRKEKIKKCLGKFLHSRLLK